ncbi:MAG: DUF5686 family protein [Balneolaceae bacterium]|nr:DUF5686 family protein [Balneolaceae bacterium]
MLILFFTIIRPAFSQIEIEGTVFDSESGETLPSATVLLTGTYRGTITNAEGHFSLTVDELPVTLQVRYIGFETAQVEITQETSLPIEIELGLSVTELEEIIVTEKDPGLSIMERVIARKQIWRENLDTYQAEAYTRQILSNDTSIVSIIESSSIVFWNTEEGHREIQVSRTQTSNISEDQNFAGVNYQPNFYDDNVEIAGYNMVGITHPDAPKFYFFELQEVQQMDGKPVYKITVSPRRERQPTFIGTAWVLGRDYALLEVDLKPNEVVNFPPPIQEFNLSYQQQFSNYGGEFWLPVDMRVEGTVRVGMVGLRFPPFLFKQTSRISDYQVNTALPDSIYQKDEILMQADSTFIAEREMEIERIPLTADETTAYQTIDSTRTFEEAFKPEGFLARMVAEEDGSADDDSGFLNLLTNWLPDGLGVRGHFNRMDGYHLGLNYENEFDDTGFKISGFGGYSFHSEMWDVGINLNQELFEVGNTDIGLNAGFEQITDVRFESRFYSLGMNSVQSLIGTEDYFDYFRNEKMYAGITLEDLFGDTDLTLSANRENHISFDENSVFDYSLFGWHRTRRINPQIEDGTLHSISGELAYNKTGTDFGFAGKNQVIFSAEHSSDALGSDFNFTRLNLRADLHINTFYQRRLFANTLDLTFSGGTAIGDLPPQRLGIADVAMGRFTPFGVIKTRHSLPYAGSKYWTVYGEHNFRTIPFELLGINYFVDKGWGIILFGGAGYADSKDVEPFNLLLSNGVHTEIGASLNSVFGVVRLDFAKRLDAPGFFIGFSVPRYF